jgi:adducin
MRQLDNMGYRTGHVYHEPLTRADQRTNRINAEIEYPPVASSFGYNDDERLQSPLRMTLERQKDQVRTHWLGTPNAYSKQEVEETGTHNPKKYTKWIAEKDPELKSSYIIKTENPNQFAPQGADPKELKQKHQEIRKEYYTDSIHAGPQSKILDGISWEEAERIKDAHVSGTTDTMIVVGAASKGIIQRDHQHNATVYKAFYQPNPFESMSQEEIDKYKKEISKEPEAETMVQTVTTHVSNNADGNTVKTVETKIEKSVSAEPVVSQITTTVSSANGEDPVSPARSTSSGELSPSKEHIDTPGTDGKKKKKFRIPSFSKKKDKKTA